MEMEIRFRVWDGEKMWYPKDDSPYTLNQKGSIWHDEWGDYRLNSAKSPIAMLSTGLKDRNGKEIWEGDRVSYNNHLSGGYHISAVEFSDGRFRPITDVNEANEPEWINIKVEHHLRSLHSDGRWRK
jgi:hypothetical protein